MAYARFKSWTLGLIAALTLAGCHQSIHRGGSRSAPDIQDLREGQRQTHQKLDDLLAGQHQTHAQLQELIQWTHQQGTGEITLFFAPHESKIRLGSESHHRLITFLDYLARESHGRKIIFYSFGQASASGLPSWNQNLAERRAWAPIPIAKQYLMHIPHEFVRIQSLGTASSPSDIALSEHRLYRNVRLIATYEEPSEENPPAP